VLKTLENDDFINKNRIYSYIFDMTVEFVVDELKRDKKTALILWNTGRCSRCGSGFGIFIKIPARARYVH